jgi:hypothetical protein
MLKVLITNDLIFGIKNSQSVKYGFKIMYR